MNGFSRLIKSGITNFFRNIWLSIAATSVMTITLFLISSVLVIYFLSAISLSNIKDKVGITAYFNSNVSETEIQNIKDEISRLPEVKDITYIPKDLAKDKFIEAHKDEPLLVETINEFSESDNPLPASLAIRATDLPQYKAIADTLNSDRYKTYFGKIRDNNKVIERLQSITDAITKSGIALSLIFIIVTIMVMFNTIRLTVYNRREEVEIMRLVGATNWYIRGPFIIEGALYGLLAMLIASGITIGALYAFAGKISSAIGLTRAELIPLMNSHVWQIVAINLVLGVGLGVIGSSIAIRRYLKV